MTVRARVCERASARGRGKKKERDRERYEKSERMTVGRGCADFTSQ